MVRINELPSAQVRAILSALETVGRQTEVRRSDVANKADVSESTASRALKQLERTGWLVREQEGDHIYYVGPRGAAVGRQLDASAGEQASFEMLGLDE